RSSGTRRFDKSQSLRAPLAGLALSSPSRMTNHRQCTLRSGAPHWIWGALVVCACHGTRAHSEAATSKSVQVMVEPRQFSKAIQTAMSIFGSQAVPLHLDGHLVQGGVMLHTTVPEWDGPQPRSVLVQVAERQDQFASMGAFLFVLNHGLSSFEI